MRSAGAVLLIVLIAGAALAAVDLQRAQAQTLVVYTTPALKDLLEKDILPRFEASTGHRVSTVYVAAGEQYNRLRMSGDSPEADLFLHASPLFIEKGYADGYFDPVLVQSEETRNASFRSREVDRGRIWYTFAWSPLVEVYAPSLAEAPDLATAEVDFGLAHPLLSNNGIYNVLYFETLDREAGKHALSRTSVQPTNARSSINGIADGSFDLTLGYEAVTLQYKAKGAQVALDLPNLRGERHLVQVLVSAGVVRDHPHAHADEFLQFLFTDETQEHLAKYYFRSVREGAKAPEGSLDLTSATPVPFDWAQWEGLESHLKDYEVRS